MLDTLGQLALFSHLYRKIVMLIAIQCVGTSKNKLERMVFMMHCQK